VEDPAKYESRQEEKGKPFLLSGESLSQIPIGNCGVKVGNHPSFKARKNGRRGKIDIFYAKGRG